MIFPIKKSIKLSLPLIYLKNNVNLKFDPVHLGAAERKPVAYKCPQNQTKNNIAVKRQIVR